MNIHFKRAFYCILVQFSMVHGMVQIMVDDKNHSMLPEPFAEQFFLAANKGDLNGVKAAFEALDDQQRYAVLAKRCGPAQFIRFKRPVKLTGIEFVCAMADIPVLQYILENLPGNDEKKQALMRRFQIDACMSFRFVENRVVPPKAPSLVVASKNSVLDAKAVALAALFKSNGIEFSELHFDLVAAQKLVKASEFIAQSMEPGYADLVKKNSPERIKSDEFAHKYLNFFNYIIT